MNQNNLVTNVSIRLNLDDMEVLRKEARKLRVPVSTYCRTMLTKNINQNEEASSY
jgi:hypothetical protein